MRGHKMSDDDTDVVLKQIQEFQYVCQNIGKKEKVVGGSNLHIYNIDKFIDEISKVTNLVLDINYRKNVEKSIVLLQTLCSGGSGLIFKTAKKRNWVTTSKSKTYGANRELKTLLDKIKHDMDEKDKERGSAPETGAAGGDESFDAGSSSGESFDPDRTSEASFDPDLMPSRELNDDSESEIDVEEDDSETEEQRKIREENVETIAAELEKQLQETRLEQERVTKEREEAEKARQELAEKIKKDKKDADDTARESAYKEAMDLGHQIINQLKEYAESEGNIDEKIFNFPDNIKPSIERLRAKLLKINVSKPDSPYKDLRDLHNVIVDGYNAICRMEKYLSRYSAKVKNNSDIEEQYDTLKSFLNLLTSYQESNQINEVIITNLVNPCKTYVNVCITDTKKSMEQIKDNFNKIIIADLYHKKNIHSFDENCLKLFENKSTFYRMLYNQYKTVYAICSDFNDGNKLSTKYLNLSYTYLKECDIASNTGYYLIILYYVYQTMCKDNQEGTYDASILESIGLNQDVYKTYVHGIIDTVVETGKKFIPGTEKSIKSHLSDLLIEIDKNFPFKTTPKEEPPAARGGGRHGVKVSGDDGPLYAPSSARVSRIDLTGFHDSDPESSGSMSPKPRDCREEFELCIGYMKYVNTLDISNAKKIRETWKKIINIVSTWFKGNGGDIVADLILKRNKDKKHVQTASFIFHVISVILAPEPMDLKKKGNLIDILQVSAFLNFNDKSIRFNDEIHGILVNDSILSEEYRENIENECRGHTQDIYDQLTHIKADGDNLPEVTFVIRMIETFEELAEEYASKISSECDPDLHTRDPDTDRAV